MAIDTPLDIGYSLNQEKQILSLRNQVIILKELLGKRIENMMKDIAHNRLERKIIVKIRNICNEVLKEKYKGEEQEWQQ